jgi:gamma-glutamyl-gamma-aminobutyrate hydrolase PuuD
MSVLASVRPVVAVTQREDFISDRQETRDALDQRLIDWIFASGGLPVSVPNFTEAERALDAWLARISPDALILSGGNDIGQAVRRDLVETKLLSWAERNCTPVLGLCRGMQMMAVHAGGGLVRTDGHVHTRHVLGRPADWPGEVNSYHDWTFFEVPPGYAILAQAEDGAIEAMRHQTLPWEAWMWHPERDSPFNLLDIERWRRLMNHEEI